MKKTILTSAVLAAITAVPALADENTEEKLKTETIAIVGKTTNTEITSAQIENYQATDLEDIFRHIPSVTIGGSLGIAQKMYIRGVEDTLLNITVDGAPQTSSLFHHTGRLSIEPELLKSVEVQAGAGEATAGFGSIGGAVRFKTKNADDLLDEGKTFGGIIKAGYFSNGGHKSSITLYGKAADKIGLLASFVDVHKDNIEDGDGNQIAGTQTDQTLGFIKLDAEIADNQVITASYESRKEDGAFPKQTNWTPTESSSFTQTWSNRETAVLNYTGEINDLFNIEATLYNTDSELKRELYTWTGSIESTGFDIRNTSYIGSHAITYGAEQRQDKLLAQSYSDSFGGIYKEKGNIAGFYIQDHWQILDNLLLSFGVRHDDYELDHTGQNAVWEKVDGVWVTKSDENGNPVTTEAKYSSPKQDGLSKNFGFEYNLTSNLTLSAGYAEALRGRQTTDTFIVGELSGFNNDLKPEQVENREVGLEYNNGSLLLEVSAYNSQINDVLFDKFKGGTYYENIGQLESTGFELVAGYQADSYEIVVSYNSNDVELNNAEFLWPDANSESGSSIVVLDGVDIEAYEFGHLGNQGGDIFNVNFAIKPTEQLDIGWNFNYVRALNNINVFYRSIELGWTDALDQVNKPEYKVHDMYVKYQALDNLTLDLSIQNIFDETYRSHGSVADFSHIAGYEGVVGLNEPGRDIRLSASFKF
ncbi:TonB-dependent receptor domain-containing protein [Catenovulum agarivorans]|uniref:TonB-dependent receptor domain-containing protein n=1 Tax=Catenovulum agarivorans TaxID=1172192 RepID=UPI0002EDFE57|nr:TonB-dependent receptor [Catenovulum agarivorans]